VAYPPYASALIYAYVCKHPTHKTVADEHSSEQLQIIRKNDWRIKNGETLIVERMDSE